MNPRDDDEFPDITDDKEYEVPKVSPVTRVEVIDHSSKGVGGRAYVHWNKDTQAHIDFQDEGRTLKVFISDRP